MVAKPLEISEAELVSEPVHPRVAEARVRYRHEFDSLLAHRQQHPDEKWVAYHGATRLGFGRTKVQLIRECQKQGLPLAECLIVGIDPAVRNPNE